MDGSSDDGMIIPPTNPDGLMGGHGQQQLMANIGDVDETLIRYLVNMAETQPQVDSNQFHQNVNLMQQQQPTLNQRPVNPSNMAHQHQHQQHHQQQHQLHVHSPSGQGHVAHQHHSPGQQVPQSVMESHQNYLGYGHQGHQYNDNSVPGDHGNYGPYGNRNDAHTPDLQVGLGVVVAATSSPSVSHVSETTSESSYTMKSIPKPVPIQQQSQYSPNSRNDWKPPNDSPNRFMPSLQAGSLVQAKGIPGVPQPIRGPQSRQVSRLRASAMSGTSTPIHQLYNNSNHNGSVTESDMPKVQPMLNSDDLATKADSVIAEKRTVVIFRVVDQIVYQGKVLKATVVKDEEVIRSCGNVHWPETSETPSTSFSSVRSPHSFQSGMLADVSSSVKTSSSSAKNSPAVTTSQHQLQQNSSSNKQESKNSGTAFRKIPQPVGRPPKHKTQDTPPKAKVENSTSRGANAKEGSKKEQSFAQNDQDHETAALLLSLQQDRSAAANSYENEHDAFTRITPGCKVLAKWSDRNFYPATVASAAGISKWLVTFEDGARRTLTESELLAVPYLPSGQSVMVTISAGYCVKGVVQSFDDTVYTYTVEVNEGEKTVVRSVPRRDVFLTSDQANIFKGKPPKPAVAGTAAFADVDLDNIVCGKRSRARQTKVQEADTSSNSRESRKAGKGSAKSSNYDSDEEFIPNKIKKMSNENNAKAIVTQTAAVVQLPPTATERENSQQLPLSNSPRTTKTNLLAISKTMPLHELEKLLGPIPAEGSQIFNGYAFLLTSGDRVKDELGNAEDNHPERSTPVDKTYLLRQIEAGGGQVLESFELLQVSKDDFKEIVLIADTYHRSIKYMQCLAAGIPCVSHMWIIECCRQNELLKRDTYALPAGYSVVTNSLRVVPVDKNTLKKSTSVFKGMKFYLGTRNVEKLRETWIPVLQAANATVVDEIPSSTGTSTRKQPNSVDMIIADPSCPADILKKAKQMRIPVVSSEYIVQCLINGRKLGPDTNPKFQHTFKP